MSKPIVPSHADIVIIGGGIHGSSLAFHLAEAKAGKIVLLEKRHLASGPTSRSGAMVRPLFTQTVYVQLVSESTRMFESWRNRVGGESGFVQNGFLRITSSLEQTVIGGDLELTKECGQPYEIFKVADLPSVAPTGTFNGQELGILFPRGGYADPFATTVSLASSAERLGATIVEGVQVTGIETQNSAVSGVQTDMGRIDAPVVVNCAGVWSDRIAHMASIELPIEIHRTPTGFFRRPEAMRTDGPILSDGVNLVYARPLGDSILRAAHFGWTPDRSDPDQFDETVSQTQVDVLRCGLQNRFDAMKQSISWGGFSALYDMTPDGHPIVGKMRDVSGFWCNCGWSGNGFAPAPAVGKCLAQMILGSRSDIDLSVFRWPRSGGVVPRPDLQWVDRSSRK